MDKTKKIKKDFRITMEEDLFNSLTNLARLKGISRNKLALEQLHKIYKNNSELEAIADDIKLEIELSNLLKEIKTELNRNGILLNQIAKQSYHINVVDEHINILDDIKTNYLELLYKINSVMGKGV